METGRPHGVQRVCQLRAQPRSAVHARHVRAAQPHDGTITTAAPNVVWGTDGAEVSGLDEGWIWMFVAVEHWNVGRVGWHGTEPRLSMPPSSRSRKGWPRSSVRWAPTRRAAWSFGWIMARSTCRITSSTRSASGASLQASPSWRSRRPTGSRNASSAPCRSSPSTTGCSARLPRCEQRSPSSSPPATSTG